VSQENVEVVLAAFDAFQHGDMKRVLRLCDDNIEITRPAELPGVSARQHGHAGVLDAFAVWPEQWDDYRIDILRINDMGDHVLVTTLQSGIGKGSRVRVETRFSFLFSDRACKITRWRIFMREEEALKAVGLE
jgi:ketosteroid isomerase-like protein